MINLFNLGISGPGVVRSVVEKNKDCNLTALSEAMKRTTFKLTRAGELVGRELASNLNVPFGIVDISHEELGHRLKLSLIKLY